MYAHACSLAFSSLVLMRVRFRRIRQPKQVAFDHHGKKPVQLHLPEKFSFNPKGDKTMLQKKIWIPILIVLIALVGYVLFYGQLLDNQESVKVYKPVEVESQTTPKLPPPGETAESGHWHGDVWHAEPHETHAC